MRLRILLPTRVLLEERVRKIVAEAQNGHFCLLPRHVDFVSALVPGILTLVAADGRERFLAVDEGVLVKVGREVRVSTRNAIPGESLEELRGTVEREFLVLDEHERAARSAVARLEAGVLRRFLELEEMPR